MKVIKSTGYVIAFAVQRWQRYIPNKTWYRSLASGKCWPQIAQKRWNRLAFLIIKVGNLDWKIFTGHLVCIYVDAQIFTKLIQDFYLVIKILRFLKLSSNENYFTNFLDLTDILRECGSHLYGNVILLSNLQVWPKCGKIKTKTTLSNFTLYQIKMNISMTKTLIKLTSRNLHKLWRS